LDFCSTIAYNTFNTIKDHEPVGPMARIRRGIYARAQQKRILYQTGKPWLHDITLQDIENAKVPAASNHHKVSQAQVASESSSDNQPEKHGDVHVKVTVDVE